MTEKKKRAAEGYTGSYETGAGTRWERKATVTLLDDTRNVGASCPARRPRRPCARR